MSRGQKQIRGVRERKERADTVAAVEAHELKRHRQYIRILHSAVAFDCQEAAAMLKQAGLPLP